MGFSVLLVMPGQSCFDLLEVDVPTVQQRFSQNPLTPSSRRTFSFFIFFLAFPDPVKYNDNHYRFSTTLTQRTTDYPLPPVTPFSGGLLARQPVKASQPIFLFRKPARFGRLYIS